MIWVSNELCMYIISEKSDITIFLNVVPFRNSYKTVILHLCYCSEDDMELCQT